MLVSSCEPELGDVPFSCDAEGLCPEGYRCEATVCVKDGATPGVARPMRATWINAAELYWFPSPRGGATLIVNEGFTPGGRALFEFHVNPDGSVEPGRELLDLREEAATSTAVVALDDQSYGVLTLRFPSFDEDDQELAFTRIDRDLPPGETPTSDVLYRAHPPYLGGSEPAYVSAVRSDEGVDICFTDPSLGGALVVRRLVGGDVTRELSIDLDAPVLPLSGDCLIWAAGGDRIVRAGLESPELYRIPASAEVAADVEGPLEVPGLPVYAFDDGVVSLVPSGDGGRAELGFFNYSGGLIEKSPEFATQETLEPHTAWSSPGGVLFAPTAEDGGFAQLSVLSLASGSFVELGGVTRASTDELYSARAFSDGERLFVAWTSFHEDLMDLWVGVGEVGQ